MWTRDEETQPEPADLAPYAARWVALVGSRVVGVGWTAYEARLAAKRNRPRVEPRVVFVPATEASDDESSSA